MAINTLQAQSPMLATRAKAPGAPAATVAKSLPLSQDTIAIRNSDALLTRPQLSHIGKAVSPTAAAPFRPGNKIDYYVGGEEAFPMLHQVIDSAKHRIDMEYFSFFNDETGNAMADKLIAKAQSGVQVNLLLNHGNSFKHQALADRMIAGGVRVHYFTNGHQHLLPIPQAERGVGAKFLNGATLHPSDTVDHKKVTLVDGKIGVTGGMNIGDPYAKYWHDGMTKVEGPTVQDMYAQFEKNWGMSNGEALRPTTIDTAAKGDVTAQFAVTRPKLHEVKSGMLAAFGAAKDNIKITSPYFIDEDLVSSLEAASKRGVKVHAIIPTVGDNPMVDMMNDSVSNRLKAAGVDVHRYDTMNYDFGKHDHGTDHFNHIKAYTVDDTFAGFGTANADSRSMAHNQEDMIQVDDAATAQKLNAQLFDKDMATLAKPAEITEEKGLKGLATEILNKFRFAF